VTKSGLAAIGACALVAIGTAAAAAPPPQGVLPQHEPAAGTLMAQVPPRRVSAAPGNYRQLAADAAAKTLKRDILVGAQISALSAPRATQLGDWTACLKTRIGLFALFFEDAEVFNIRRAVAVDQCEQAAYGAMPRPRIPVSDDDEAERKSQPDAKSKAEPKADPKAKTDDNSLR